MDQMQKSLKDSLKMENLKDLEDWFWMMDKKLRDFGRLIKVRLIKRVTKLALLRFNL